MHLTLALPLLSLLSLVTAHCSDDHPKSNVKAVSNSHAHHHAHKKNHKHHTTSRAAKAHKKLRKGGQISGSGNVQAVVKVKAVKTNYSGSSSSLSADDTSSSGDTVGSSSSSTGHGQSSSSSSSTAMSLLAKVSSGCGFASPSAKVSTGGGPNGLQSWMGCGIDGGGWNPPTVTMDMVTTKTLEEAGELFAPCQKFTSIFEKYGAKFNIPPIFLASFAMQESSCNPDTTGDSGGAFGLMQLTSDKCSGAPGGKCTDPDYNVMMGAKTFVDGLNESGGNVLLALGAYNGWFKGMTTGDATKARYGGCCECQQNLSYLQQYLNGWLQGVDPYSNNIGTINNLDSCK